MLVRCVLVFSTIALLVQSKKLPHFIKDLRCSLTNDFKNCFITNGNKVIPEISKGLPDFQLPKLNPLELPHMQSVSTPSLHLNLTNLKIYGLEELKIADVRLFNDFGGISILLKGNNVTIKGNYVVDGQILVLPIKGNGQFSLFLENGIYKPALTWKTYEKNGRKYLKSTGDQLDYHFEKITFNFENLFEGNKELGDQMNKFLNENWNLLLTDFGPGIAETLSALHRKIFDGFSSELGLYDIFME